MTKRWSAVALVAVLVTVAAAGVVSLRLDTRVDSLLPSGDRSLRAWHDIQQSFGGDPVVVLLESRSAGQLLDGTQLPRLLQLEGRLAKLDDVAVVYGPATALNQVAKRLQDFMTELSGWLDGLRSKAEADARSKGASAKQIAAAGDAAVATANRRYGSLLVQGLGVGYPSLRNPQFAPSVVLDTDGQVRSEFRWIVPDNRHLALLVRPREGLDQAGTERLVQAVRRAVRRSGIEYRSAVVTGAPAIAAATGAEVRREFPMLAVAALLGVAATFLIAHRVGRARRLLPIGVVVAATAITLGLFGWIGVPVSLGMLAFLPIVLGVGSDFPIHTAYPTRRRVIGVVAVATAVGFLTLLLSPLPFVRTLGVALALGVVLAFLVSLAVSRVVEPETEPVVAVAPTVAASAGRSRRLVAVAVGAVLAAAGLALLPSLRIESDPNRLASGLPAMADARAVEQVIGASGEVEVWMRAGNVLDPAVLHWYEAAEDRLVLRFGDRVRPILTPGRLLSWLGPNATPSQIDAGFRLLPPYITGATIRSDRKEAVALFGLRLGDLGRQSTLLRELLAALPTPPAGASVGVTGLPVVAARGYDLVGKGRIWPNVIGIAVFALVVAVGTRRLRTALRCVAAAGLAFGWGLLALRLTGTPLSPLTITLGSLTAAVGGQYVVLAVERTRAGYARPWRPVVAAATTSTIGFVALAVSRLELLRQFGLVVGGSVLLALLAAWLVAGIAPSDEVVVATASNPVVPDTRVPVVTGP